MLEERLTCNACRALANRPNELAIVARRESERAVRHTRVVALAEHQAEQLAEAARQGEPIEAAAASRALLAAAIAALKSAGFPGAEQRPLRMQKRWGKERVTESLTGYVLSKDAAPHYSTNHRGPASGPTEHLLTTDGTFMSWSTSSVTYGTTSYITQRETPTTDEDVNRLALLVARVAVRQGLQIPVPLVLTMERDRGELFAQLRTGTYR